VIPLPVNNGAERAPQGWPAWSMALPQVMVIAAVHVGTRRAARAGRSWWYWALQILGDAVLLTDPKGRTPWYKNGTGVTLTWAGMMIAALPSATPEVLP